MREHGGIIFDGKQVASTLQCPHCGGHFVSTPGSGKKRGFCFGCHGVTCGSDACEKRCLPTEKMLEEIERNATRQIRLGV